MICSSVNRLRFIAGVPAGILAESTLIPGGAVFGEQVGRALHFSSDLHDVGPETGKSARTCREGA